MLNNDLPASTSNSALNQRAATTTGFTGTRRIATNHLPKRTKHMIIQQQHYDEQAILKAGASHSQLLTPGGHMQEAHQFYNSAQMLPNGYDRHNPG